MPIRQAKPWLCLVPIGYHKKNGKLIGPNGHQLGFTLQVRTGWTDDISDT